VAKKKEVSGGGRVAGGQLEKGQDDRSGFYALGDFGGNKSMKGSSVKEERKSGRSLEGKKEVEDAAQRVGSISGNTIPSP